MGRQRREKIDAGRSVQPEAGVVHGVQFVDERVGHLVDLIEQPLKIRVAHGDMARDRAAFDLIGDDELVAFGILERHVREPAGVADRDELADRVLLDKRHPAGHDDVDRAVGVLEAGKIGVLGQLGHELRAGASKVRSLLAAGFGDADIRVEIGDLGAMLLT
ncbi:MAG: hypothetical protein M5R36_29030 [Deltaproteobacteria bacterium]|nr:hypothetical protein [Deltaproteobacteria bacterium]